MFGLHWLPTIVLIYFTMGLIFAGLTNRQLRINKSNLHNDSDVIVWLVVCWPRAIYIALTDRND